MTDSNPMRLSSTDREIIQVMRDCLRMILEDLRAQYRRIKAETDRLQKAGVSVGSIYQQLEQYGMGVKEKNVPPNTDRGVQRTGV